MWMAFRFIVELGDLGFSQIRKNIGAQYGIMYITVTTSIIWFLLVPLYRDKTGVVQQLISVLFTNEYISNLGICKKKHMFLTISLQENTQTAGSCFDGNADEDPQLLQDVGHERGQFGASLGATHHAGLVEG